MAANPPRPVPTLGYGGCIAGGVPAHLSGKAWGLAMRGVVVSGGRVLAAVLSVLLIAPTTWVGAGAGSAVADTVPPDPGTPATVSADALPTVQVDGVVWTQTVIGNTVYAGGSFTTARPAGSAPGVSTTPRGNMLAYDIRTGELIQSFAPMFDGQVLSVVGSPDGSRVYVGGEFTKVNGIPRYRVAAFNTATGALITTFAPVLDFRVRAMVATDATVYVGGAFNSASGNARTRLAAFQVSNGAVLPWAPTADAQVMAMVMAPDQSKVIVGGQFTQLNGSTVYGMGALDPVTGAVMPWAANQLVRNSGSAAAINSLSTDGTKIYGTGYVFGASGNLEGTFAANPTTGQIAWIEDCHGDTYANYPVNGVIYTVGHPHYCGNVGGFPQTNPWTFHRALAWTTEATGTVKNNTQSPGSYYNFGGQPAPSLLSWFPELEAGTYTGQTQAAWSVTGNADYVVLGGEFPEVNGVPQQGLVRFATRPLAPNAQAPLVKGTLLNPTTLSLGYTARLSWPANWDRDNEQLTYQVIRDGDFTSPVYETTARSTFWNRPAMGFTDRNLLPNTQYRYRLRVTDPTGNTVLSDSVFVTTPAKAQNDYSQTVLDDGAATYWRLGEPNGTTVYDWSGVNDGLAGAGVTRGTAGAIVGDSDTASTFNGATNSMVATRTAIAAPNQFSAEAWFKTNTTRGGKIIGFGSSASGNSSTTDRHVYMLNNGRLIFGVNPGGTQRTVTSAASFNNNQWHHVVATLGSEGMVLYVDGAVVGQSAAATSGQAYAGYWRVGGDNLSGWPSRPTSGFLAGAVDDVAIYPTVLSAAQVGSHRLIGSTTPAPNAAPTAAFTSQADHLVVGFDGSGSGDSDGTVGSYAWDFGDGSSGTGASPSHTYAASGTYTVTLVVTDDEGGTGSVSHPVTVTANAAPTAAFTSQVVDLVASFDGSGSADSDGSVDSYAWTFGDGSSGTGAGPSHTYAVAGTYTVTLVVTDDDGDTGSVSHPVTVSAPVTAADAFGRTLSGGWGSADAGGAWTVAGGAGNFSVGAGVGQIRMNTAGATSTASLNGFSLADTEVRVAAALDKAQTGSGTYVSVVGRKVGTADYRFRLRYLVGGGVTASLSRAVSGTETALTQVTVPGLTYAPGEVLQLRLQVSGTSPTTLRAKVWRVGQTEPAAWLVTATDGTPVLQAPGAVGLLTYISGTSTDLPLTASFDDFWAGPKP